MMKKAAAIVLILTANIILLAHAVIAHQHHEHGSTVTDSGHHHEFPHHGHERQGDESDHAFILDEEIVLRLTQGRQFIDISELQDNLSIQFQSTGLISCYKSIGYLPVLFSDASIPLIASSYICFAESSCGLRAPPSI